MKRVRANAFRGNLRPVLGKLVSLTFEKKNSDPLYIIQCSYQILKYSIVYIDENYPAVIIFNNLGIQTLVGT